MFSLSRESCPDHVGTTAAFHSALPPSSASSATAGDALHFFNTPVRDDSSSLGFFALDAITSEGLQSSNAPSSIFASTNRNEVGSDSDDKVIINNNNNNNSSSSSNNNNNNNSNNVTINNVNASDGNDTSCSTSNGVVGGTSMVLDENDR